jgi:hypothetical protein
MNCLCKYCFCKMFFSVLHCKFVYFSYLWLVPHRIVFVTRLWIHGIYVCMYESNLSSYSCSAQFSESTELCSLLKITVCDDYSSSDMVGIHYWNKGSCFKSALLDYLFIKIGCININLLVSHLPIFTHFYSMCGRFWVEWFFTRC